MNHLITRHLGAVGGLDLIRSIKSHSILCHIDAKSIHQIVKEIYNYTTGQFLIEVQAEEQLLMSVSGDLNSGSRLIHNKSNPLSQAELFEIHETIMLFPEINLLQMKESDFKMKPIVAESELESKLTFETKKFAYEFTFEKSTGLKSSFKVWKQEYPKHAVIISFSDWTEVNGILYPFQQDYFNEIVQSKKIISELKIGF